MTITPLVEEETGTFYTVEVVTDAYAGNFEREMAAYIFGAIEPGNTGGYRIVAKQGGFSYRENITRYEWETGALCGADYLTAYPDEILWAVAGPIDEYGYQEANLLRFNTGDYDIDEGWVVSCWGPDAKSVLFVFRDQPTDEQLATILKRAREYAAFAYPRDTNNRPKDILKVELGSFTIRYEYSEKPIKTVS